MADNNKDNKMSIDDFDFAHEDVNDDTPTLVNHLVTGLQQAIDNLAFQGEVQQQLHAYGILPPFQQERGPERMLRQKTARQWDKAPYEVDELSTNKKSHIPDEVLAHIPDHIFIAKFRDEEGDNIKTTIMPREIWTLHRRPEVASAYDGKAMLTDSDGAKVEVLITKEIINEALQFIPGAHDLIPKTKAIDNEKAFLKVKGSKFKYSDLIYSELELPLRLISQHLRVQKPSSSAASSKFTRSKKSSSEEERTETDKEQDSQESAQEKVPKEVETTVPSEYESDEEDTSTPLKRKSQKPRSREQVLMDEAMVGVEVRRKELADVRAAKAATKTRPMTMEKARKIRLEKAKAIQKERRRIEAEQKAQEEAKAAQAAQTQEREVIDLSGTVEYLKKLEREKHTPKRPRQEEEEEIEHIQADPIPPSPINIPPGPPSSPITPFPHASTPQTPPSPSQLDIPKSPPAPTSPQQQHFSVEPSEIPASLQVETAQPMDKVEDEKQTDGEQHQPTKVDVPILIVQENEPTNEQAIQEVQSFDYKRLIQTLSRQFQCQQVVAKETEIQETWANQAQEEIVNLRTVLELVTKEQDSSARENENLLRDLIDLQSQLTRKEAQNHELIKNERKMKEQIKYEDARFQKLNASYNTIKNTLTALLQN
ncbi:hypothetical protein L7F22_048865 [Adiantum nelumboides]|nr:hypothetical protein [Adiantum nelumboides]